MLEFDSATTAILEDVYQGADFTRRRRASFDLLAPARGEVIIDIGSGPGHMLIDIARAVGSDGHAIGIVNNLSVNVFSGPEDRQTRTTRGQTSETRARALSPS